MSVDETSLAGNLIEWLNRFPVVLENWLVGLTRPWMIYQALIVLTLLALTWLISTRLLQTESSAPANRDGPAEGRWYGQQPLMAGLWAGLRARHRLILFSVLLWITYAVMQQITWPSRSVNIGILANLVTAWLLISILSRLIRNRLLARLAATMVWLVVALNVLGFWPDVVAIADNIGMTYGENRITLATVIQALLTATVLLWTAVLLSRMIEHRISSSPDLAPATQVLLSKLFRIIALTGAIMVSLNLTGIDFTALAVFSGAVGLGLGFGLQKVISNLVSGFILLMDKSIKPGDVITLGETFGWITKLNARYVSVITRDGREYLIPNEDLITNQVINWSYTDKNVRLEIKFGVSYDSDPHQVRKLAIDGVLNVPRVLPDPAPVCHLTAFGDSSLNFVLRFWISDPAGGVVNVKGQVLLALWDVLKANNIHIPFPHREVILRDPLGGAERREP